MYKYAWVTENSPNEHEVFNITRGTSTSTGEMPKFIERIESAISANHELIGMKATQFGEQAFTDAVWDGTSFSGAMNLSEKLNEGKSFNFEQTDLYVILANNKVVFVSMIDKNSLAGQLFDAAFSQNVRLIKVNDEQVVAVGYIWDGTNFNPPA